MKKRVLITGANGYIGRHVVEAFIDKGYSVIAADLQCTDVNFKAERYTAPIFSGSKNIYDETGCPDLCIHLAWQDGFVHNAPSHMLNLSKHYEFLSNLIEAGCHNIAVMGSMHEVGYWEGKIDSNTPCNPSSQYGIAKNALRQSLLLLSKDKDVNIYWLRAYYILGDDVKNHSIFSKILMAVQDGKGTFPFNSEKNKYDFLDVKELARQIMYASIQKKYTGIINVCSGQPVSLAERVEQFINENHLPISLEYGKFPDRPYDSPIVYGDNTVIQQIMKEG